MAEPGLPEEADPAEPSSPEETESPDPAVEPPDFTAFYTLGGVAAIGRPLDGYVYIQDATGITVNVPIAYNGGYIADIEGLQAPFIIRAQAGDGSVWYSYAPEFSSNVTANITQLTTLTMFIASGKADLAGMYDAWPQFHTTLTADSMLHAQAVVNLNFDALFEANGIDYTVNYFFTTYFTADGTGFDAVLDTIGPISFGAGTYQFHNPVYQATFDEDVAVSYGYYCPPPEPRVCPEGAYCLIFTQVGCITRWVRGSSYDGFVSDGYIPPPVEIIDEQLPPEDVVDDPPQDDDAGLDDLEAITLEDALEPELPLE
ncbi:MAG: hypothetical protein HY941_12740 [Gammaproteobacteria bacterium]|nr:hypothetical protein [Gammaproteobacteria bacterium]